MNELTEKEMDIIRFALSYTSANLDHAGEFLVDRGVDLSEDEAEKEINAILEKIKEN